MLGTTGSPSTQQINQSCACTCKQWIHHVTYAASYACTVWRHGTFPTTSRASPTPTAAVFGRRHPRSWWLDVHGCPLSAIEHFWWLAAASGTVCRLTLPQLQRWLFFGIASKLSFSPNHFLTNCFPFLVLYAVYCSGLAVLYLGHSK